MNRTLWKHPSTKDLEDMHAVALKALKQAEAVLSSIIKTHPQWSLLVSAVDHRIDRALAILRPQAIANHCALLTSLGWPPPLSTLSSSDSDTKASNQVQKHLTSFGRTIDWEGMAKLMVFDEARKEFSTLRRAFDEVNTQLQTKFSQVSIIYAPLVILFMGICLALLEFLQALFVGFLGFVL